MVVGQGLSLLPKGLSKCAAFLILHLSSHLPLHTIRHPTDSLWSWVRRPCLFCWEPAASSEAGNQCSVALLLRTGGEVEAYITYRQKHHSHILGNHGGFQGRCHSTVGPAEFACPGQQQERPHREWCRGRGQSFHPQHFRRVGSYYGYGSRGVACP